MSCLSVCNVGVAYCGQTDWMDQDTSDHIVLDGDPAPQRKGTQQPPPIFRPMSIVAKRLPISATAELLSNFSVSFIIPVSLLHVRLRFDKIGEWQLLLRVADFICLRVGFRFRKSSIFLVQCLEVRGIASSKKRAS